MGESTGPWSGKPGRGARGIVRPFAVIDRIVTCLRLVMSEIHRTGALPVDPAARAAFLVDRALGVPDDRGLLMNRAPLPEAVRPACVGGNEGPPRWPRVWRDLLDRRRPGLSLPYLAFLDTLGVPYFSLDVCIGAEGFEEALARLEAANSLHYTSKTQLGPGLRKDLLLATGILILVPFASDDTGEIGRMLGSFLGLVERHRGPISRDQNTSIHPRITVFPSILVPDEWVRDGIGAPTWVPVAALYDRIG